MYSLGVNIGSSSIKVVLMDEEKQLLQNVIEHEGDFQSALKKNNI